MDGEMEDAEAMMMRTAQTRTSNGGVCQFRAGQVGRLQSTSTINSQFRSFYGVQAGTTKCGLQKGLGVHAPSIPRWCSVDTPPPFCMPSPLFMPRWWIQY
nr:uncharacterized protein CTRU02_04966 [Colletotrichum truncatum]KAF6794765.1 hypothetical protein CTRU02_04966 [Colletotrichum truncatum]